MHSKIPDQLLDLLDMSKHDQSTQDFIEISEKPLRLSIRVNTLKMSVEKFITLAKQWEWKLEPIPWCSSGFWLSLNEQQQHKLGNMIEHVLGCFYIQEASSMLPVEALFANIEAPSKDTCILDAAAAPGSKSTQISAYMDNQGLLIANEYSASRLKGLYANVRRCGVSNAALSHHNADVFGQWLANRFDAILLDAPCSGEGTYRKDKNAFDNWSLESIEQIAQLQRRLLDSAFASLKPGGVLVYSTCTLNPIENQHLIQSFIQHNSQRLSPIDLTTLFDGAQDCASDNGSLLVLPQRFDSEGFYVAALRKNLDATAVEEKPRKPRNSGFKTLNCAQDQAIRSYFCEQFGFKFSDDVNLYNRDNEYWLFAKPMPQFEQRFRFSRLGLKLADQHKKVLRANHEVAIALGHLFTKNHVEISREQCIAFLDGKDLLDINGLEELDSGDLLLRYQGYSVGFAKNLKHKLKNAIPRDLINNGKLY